MIHMTVLAYSQHGGASDLVGYVVRGFAMSVGFMIARGMGVPAALASLVVGGLAWWLWRRRRS